MCLFLDPEKNFETHKVTDFLSLIFTFSVFLGQLSYGSVLSFGGLRLRLPQLGLHYDKPIACRINIPKRDIDIACKRWG